MADRRFHKITRKYQDPGINLRWAEPCEGEWIQRSADDPHPATEEFRAAFADLAAYINAPLGHSVQQSQGLVVLGVTLKYNKEGARWVLLSACRPIEGFSSPLIINLPKQNPVGELSKALDTLEDLASRYLEGEKGQLELFEGGADDESE